MGRFLFTVCLCWLLAAGAAAEQVVLTLTVGGDCVLGTREEWQQEEGTFLTMVAERGMDWPFRNLREIFLEDDMTLLNLECVLQADNRATTTASSTPSGAIRPTRKCCPGPGWSR